MLTLKFDFHLNITVRCLKTKQTKKQHKTNQKKKNESKYNKTVIGLFIQNLI